MISSDQHIWRCFSLIARHYGMAVNVLALQEKYAPDNHHNIKIQFVRGVRETGLKCRCVESVNITAVKKMPLPAVIELPEMGYVILLAIKDDEWLIQPVNNNKPIIFNPVEDECYQLFLFARRFSWGEIKSEFNLSWFANAFGHYKKLIGEVLLASFFIQVLALISPLFFQVVVDKVLTHQSLTTLDVLALGMVVVSLFDVILNGLRNYQLAHTSQRIDVTLSSLLYKHLLALPLTWFMQRQAGVIVARVHELKTIREFLTGSAMSLCLDLFFTLIFFIVMAFYSIPLTLIVIVSLIPYILLSMSITPILRERLDEQFKQGARNQAFLVESLTGIESVKAMSVENLMNRRWDEQVAAFVTSCFKTQNIGNIAGQISKFVSKITSVAILWYGAHQVIEAQLTVGALIAFNMFAGQVTAPVLRLVQLWQDFQQVSVSVRRLGDILNMPVEHQECTATLAEVKGAIKFSKVSFSWQVGGSPVLDNISLTIRPREIIGIAGRSGSGKSTLTRLIQRLCIPTSGQIYIDGIDIAQTDPHWLRKQIGVVLQETQLFNGTIRDNIALALPEATLEQVVEVAKLAGAHEFISEFPQGYDTPVGEHGGRLSGGQKQRVGIARALITNPRIIIFDEATSALDYESEYIIQRNMAEISRDRTVFIIAHRLSALRTAGRILVMEKGKIAEQGSHKQLLELKGVYSRLHDLQESSV
uniref:type I secretion system permease/ATPase n=1 Tax=Scandinavium goeteborgense TaxID=1851514 RepID=UPI00135CAACE|nr:type I secretion system permease/ATPase [Scandinavium goeteborgense]